MRQTKISDIKKGPQIAVGSHLAPAPCMHGALPRKGQVWIPLFLY